MTLIIILLERSNIYIFLYLYNIYYMYITLPCLVPGKWAQSDVTATKLYDYMTLSPQLYSIEVWIQSTIPVQVLQ